MGWLKNLFAGGDGGSVVKDTVEGVGSLAKDLREAITGDMPAEKKAELTGKALDILAGISTMQGNVVIAEASGKSWLQRSWRPITMLSFLVLVILDSFGLLVNPLAKEAWTLLQIGLGGYVVGRSAEKIATQIIHKGDEK